MTRLDSILESTRVAVARRESAMSEGALRSQIDTSRPERHFAETLGHPGMSLIAEHKRSSPSAGVIRADLDLSDVISAYEAGGASALSILTEEEGFGGSLDDLRLARSLTDLPILRKDFIVGTYQLVEAAEAGADAILLIVAALEESELAELAAEAHSLRLDVLTEVHDEAELETALASSATLIGINNRNLKDFSVDLGRTFELLADVPAGKTVVSESGISTAAELHELERVGVDAVLVGEALMRSADIADAVKALLDRT
ncbi:MAG: indole-3-glycerol phosphate synthase TrpC [Solirubrobacterales bacterium]|nr:indole-3-glycerol phosphate synthase TrpC [Solirubrobacterales bacterium]